MTDFDQLKIEVGKETTTVSKWNGMVNLFENYVQRLHLSPKGQLGIGTGGSDLKGALHISLIENPPPLTSLNGNENGLILGTTGASGYKWIQSYGSSLALNPLGQRVGIGTNNPSATLSVVAKDKAQVEFKRGTASGAIEQNGSGGALRLQDTNNQTKIQLRTYEASYFNNGRVGIGTTTPQTRLDIHGGGLMISPTGNGDASLQLFTSRPDLNKGAWSQTAGSGNEAWTIWARNKNHSSQSKNLVIAYFDDRAWKVYLAIKEDSGNVGIGTVSPSTKLHVEGHIKAKGLTTTTKLINFERYSPDKFRPITGSYLYIHDTNYSSDIWDAGVVGFNSGAVDIQEEEDGLGIAIHVSIHNNKWRVWAALRVHRQFPSWTIDVMFVRRSISQRSGY